MLPSPFSGEGPGVRGVSGCSTLYSPLSPHRSSFILPPSSFRLWTVGADRSGLSGSSHALKKGFFSLFWVSLLGTRQKIVPNRSADQSGPVHTDVDVSFAESLPGSDYQRKYFRRFPCVRQRGLA